jgi:hypothetical protein
MGQNDLEFVIGDYHPDCWWLGKVRKVPSAVQIPMRSLVDHGAARKEAYLGATYNSDLDRRHAESDPQIVKCEFGLD